MITPELDEARFEMQRRAIFRRGGLHNFVRLAWPHISPAKFVDGKHIRVLCNHLEAVTFGECQKLVVNVPPGTSKTMVTSVIYPVWDWLFFPHHRFMYATFDDSLASRDSEASRNLLVTPWFRRLFGDQCGHQNCNHPRVTHSRFEETSRSAADTLGVWWNSNGGFRFSTTVESKATGWHAHRQIIDDPTKPQSILGGATDAKNALSRVKTWFSGTMATRRADPSDFARIIIMQRLHDDDLSGHVLREGGWTHLNLPMEFDPDTRCVTPWGADWRDEKGELLCPERFPPDVVAELKKDMGPIIYSAQENQNPVPPEGGILQETWIEYHDETAESLIAKGAVCLQSWDAAFEDSPESDRVAGHLWFWLPSDDCFYLTDVDCSVRSFVQTVESVKAFCKRFPFAWDKLVEKKANGPAIVNTLSATIGGFTLVAPLGSKAARVVAVSPAFAARRVKVKRDQSWTADVVKEWTRFPKYGFDDNVDAMTQALAFWLKEDSGWTRWMGHLFDYYGR